MSKMMIQKKFINYCIVFCALIFFMLCAIQVTQAQTIAITVPDVNAGEGEFVYIPVTIDDVFGLTNWDVVIQYDPTLLIFYGTDVAGTVSENYYDVVPAFTGAYPGDLYDPGLLGSLVSGLIYGQYIDDPTLQTHASGVLFYAVFLTQNVAGNTATIAAAEAPQGVGDPPPVPVDTANPSIDIGVVTQPVLSEAGFSAPDYTVAEGAGNATITVNLSAPFYQDVTVDYSTNPITATSGDDYTTTYGTLTFAPFETTQTFTVPIIQDNKVEATESLNLALSGPSANLLLGAPNPAVLSITDDDTTRVSFNPVNYSVAEGGTATLIVTLSNPSDGTVVVNYATKDGTALNPYDYTSTTGTVTFAPGVMTQTLTVPTVNDIRVEGNEKFSVELSNPSPAATTLLGANATASVTIVDNENQAMVPWLVPPLLGVTTPSFPATSTPFTNPLYTVYRIPFSTSYTQLPWSLGQTTIPGFQTTQWSIFTYAPYWNWIGSWGRFSYSSTPLFYSRLW